TVVQIDPLRLRARVPEVSAASITRGVRLRFRTDSLPGETFDAAVTDISPVVDAQSRTLTAEARVSNPQGRLRPGMFVQVEAVLGESQPAIMAPVSSLAQFAGLTRVFVL